MDRPHSANSYMPGYARSRSNMPRAASRSRPNTASATLGRNYSNNSNNNSASFVAVNSSKVPIEFEKNQNVLLSFRPKTFGSDTAPLPLRNLPNVTDIVSKLQRRLNKTISTFGKENDKKPVTRKTMSNQKRNMVVPVNNDDYLKEDDDRTGEVSEFSPRDDLNPQTHTQTKAQGTAPNISLAMEHSQHAVHTSYHDCDTPFGVDQHHKDHHHTVHVNHQQVSVNRDSAEPTSGYRIGYRDSMDEDDTAMGGRGPGEPETLTVEEAKAVREITSALEQCLRDS